MHIAVLQLVASVKHVSVEDGVVHHDVVFPAQWLGVLDVPGEGVLLGETWHDSNIAWQVLVPREPDEHCTFVFSVQ